jgi:cyclophilin family peptidyl-prolyl cis-trans isomerase
VRKRSEALRRLLACVGGTALLIGLSAHGVSAATVCKHGSAKPHYRFETVLGSFVVELCAEDNPVTVDNFISYIDDGSFTNAGFIHRSVQSASFSIFQGGGFYADATPEVQFVAAKPPIPLNSKLPHRRGTIAMARTSVLDSATSQWFINSEANHFWDPTLDPSLPGGTDPKTGYTVFGQVIQGMDVVDALAALPTSNFGGAFTDIPLDGWTNGADAFAHLVYVTDYVYVPEPTTALQTLALLATLTALARRRRCA